MCPVLSPFKTLRNVLPKRTVLCFPSWYPIDPLPLLSICSRYVHPPLSADIYVISLLSVLPRSQWASIGPYWSLTAVGPGCVYLYVWYRRSGWACTDRTQAICSKTWQQVTDCGWLQERSTTQSVIWIYVSKHWTPFICVPSDLLHCKIRERWFDFCCYWPSGLQWNAAMWVVDWNVFCTISTSVLSGSVWCECCWCIVHIGFVSSSAATSSLQYGVIAQGKCEFVFSTFEQVCEWLSGVRRLTTDVRGNG